MKRILTVLVIGLSLFGGPTLAQSTLCFATASKFKIIQNGMSIDEVESIIGCRGETLSENQMAGIHTIMIAWSGRGGVGANMNAMFQNDRLIMKSQFGLR